MTLTHGNVEGRRLGLLLENTRGGEAALGNERGGGAASRAPQAWPCLLQGDRAEALLRPRTSAQTPPTHDPIPTRRVAGGAAVPRRVQLVQAVGAAELAAGGGALREAGGEEPQPPGPAQGARRHLGAFAVRRAAASPGNGAPGNGVLLETAAARCVPGPRGAGSPAGVVEGLGAVGAPLG